LKNEQQVRVAAARRFLALTSFVGRVNRDVLNDSSFHCARAPSVAKQIDELIDDDYRNN
jgi:hypothetical protein